MTDFSDIRASFSRYSESKTKFWNDLDDKAWRVYLGFEEYLGLRGARYKDPNLGEQRYVQAGNKDGGEFKAVAAPLFGGENMEVLFTIRLIVDLEASVFPKTVLDLDLRVGKEGPQYKVSLRGPDGWHEVPVAGSFEPSQLKALFEMMAQEVLRRIDPTPFS